MKNSTVVNKTIGRNVNTVKLTLAELRTRLYAIHRNKNKVSSIIKACYSWYAEDGLYITYDKNDGCFVVVNSNPKYEPLMGKSIYNNDSKNVINVINYIIEDDEQTKRKRKKKNTNKFDKVLFKFIKKIKKLVSDKKLFKKKISDLITIIASIISTIFTVIVIWNDCIITFNLPCQLIWMVCQLIVMMYVYYSVTEKYFDK